MSALDGTAWPKVRPHYDERIQIHRELLSLRKQGNTRQFAALLLGVSNPAGNYSADEHALVHRRILKIHLVTADQCHTRIRPHGKAGAHGGNGSLASAGRQNKATGLKSFECV